MMWCWSPLFVTMALAILSLVMGDMESSKYMYSDKSPPVREYKGTENDFTKSNAPRIVEFYSPYCGGCRMFKDRYIELATEITAQHKNVEFYALSCVAHKEVCNKHKIRGYPSLFAFPEKETEGTYLQRDGKEKGGHGVKSLLEGLGLEVKAATDRKLDDAPKVNVDMLKDNGDDDAAMDDMDEEAIKERDERKALRNNEETEEEDADTEEYVDTDEEDSNTEEDDTEEDVDTADEEEDVESEEEEEEKEGTKDEVHDDDNEFEDEKDEETEEDEYETEDDPSRDVRKPAAGAQLSRNAPKDMDRWKAIMAERRKKLAERRANKKLLAAKQRQKQQTRPLGQASYATNTAPASQQQGSTKTMLANTPGTPEFERRKKEIMDRIRKAQGRGKIRLPNQKDPALTYQKVFKKGNLPMVKDLKKQTILQKGMQKVPVVKRFVKITPEEQLYWDVSHSFVTALRYSVFTSSEPLTAKKKDALKSWLELISVSLPPEWALHELVDELHSSIEYISQSDLNLKRVLNKHPLQREGWSPSCSKGRDGQGYSCGMWKLLHIMTLGVAEHRGGNNLVEADVVDRSTRVFSPMEAADTMREYMAHFFGCVNCRNNFIAKYDDCSFRRCVRLTDNSDSSDPADWKQLALWLWEVHNDVSVRIASKNGRDEVKALWPSLALCLVCFEEDGSFDEDSVFELLETTYWSGSLDPKTDRLLSFKKVDSGRTGLSFLWVMMGMAVTLVVVMRRQIKTRSPFNVNMIASPSAMLRRSGMGGAKVRSV